MLICLVGAGIIGLMIFQGLKDIKDMPSSKENKGCSLLSIEGDLEEEIRCAYTADLANFIRLLDIKIEENSIHESALIVEKLSAEKAKSNCEVMVSGIF